MAQTGAGVLRAIGFRLSACKAIRKSQQHSNRACRQSRQRRMFKHSHSQYTHHDGLTPRLAGLGCRSGPQAAQHPQKDKGRGLQKAHGERICQQVEVGQALMTGKHHKHAQQPAKSGPAVPDAYHPRKAEQAKAEQRRHARAHKPVKGADFPGLAKKNRQKVVGVASAPGQPFAGNFIQPAGQIKGEHGSGDFIKVIPARKQKAKGIGKGQQHHHQRHPPSPTGIRQGKSIRLKFRGRGFTAVCGAGIGRVRHMLTDLVFAREAP